MRKPYHIRSAHDLPMPEGVEVVSENELAGVDHKQVACWLIDMYDWQAGWQIMRQLRRHQSPAVYLRPIIYLMDHVEVAAEIRQAADGIIERDRLDHQRLEDWVSRLEPINHWIDQLPDTETALDTNIAFKTLRMVASRNHRLEPIMTARRDSGFVYPLLEPMFGKRDTSVLETLSFLEQQNLLRGDFFSRAHFCGHCGSAFLNFMESCPQCNASELKIDELIHHYKCAYTAPMTEFRQGGDLVCPKCERELRHIGVDYDRPSIVYQCRQCNHTFQEPKINTACYACGRTAEPENQIQREIQSYTISAIGQNAAEFGMEALFTNILDAEMRLYSQPAFRDFLAVEKARITRYKKTSSTLVLIHFDDLNQLYVRLGARAREVFTELSMIFKTVLRESDVITARNESIFLVVMTETDKASAEVAVKRLQSGVTELFSNNLQFSPEMSVLIHAVGKETDLDSLLEAFLADAAA